MQASSNLDVVFIEQGHQYKNKVTGEKYISVTTLIGKYEPEFDTDYWSLYKAIKDVLVYKNEWFSWRFNNGCGGSDGWKRVVPTWKRLQDNLIAPSEHTILHRQEQYKKRWKEKNAAALDKGSIIHGIKEAEIKIARSHKAYGNLYNEYVREERPIDERTFVHRGVYPELLLHNTTYGVCGLADIVFVDLKDHWIDDYKTNEKIDEEGFDNQTLLGPLAELPNCNKSVYTMQLSTYAYMMEGYGFNPPKHLKLIHMSTLDSKPVDIFLPYRKDLVINMLNDFKSKQ